MSDLISREALIEAMMDRGVWYHGKKVYDLITNAPAIEQGEPVAWMQEHPTIGLSVSLKRSEYHTKPLYSNQQSSMQTNHVAEISRVYKATGMSPDLDWRVDATNIEEGTKLYTTPQQPQEQDELVKKAVADALEEAANLCVEISAEHNDPFQSMRCANAIRALIKRNAAKEGE